VIKMKCLNCKFHIPNDAAVCGHCGHPTYEQNKHAKKFAWCIIVVVIPYSLLMGFIYQDTTINLWMIIPGIVLFIIVFKKIFRGEFKKTGYF